MKTTIFLLIVLNILIFTTYSSTNSKVKEGSCQFYIPLFSSVKAIYENYKYGCPISDQPCFSKLFDLNNCFLILLSCIQIGMLAYSEASTEWVDSKGKAIYTISWDNIFGVQRYFKKENYRKETLPTTLLMGSFTILNMTTILTKLIQNQSMSLRKSCEITKKMSRAFLFGAVPVFLLRKCII